MAKVYGVSRKTLYCWKKQNQKRVEIDKTIKDLVISVRKYLPRVGGKKLYHILQFDLLVKGIKVGRDKFLASLKRQYLQVPRRKKFMRTTDSNHLFNKHSNLVKGMAIKRSEQLWMSDITYVQTKEGNLYLSLITDAYSKRIMGYKLAETLKTSNTKSALCMAINNRIYPKRKLVHHSDRGIQYCCPEYTDVLNKNRIKISMTTQYDPYENSIAERVNGILKGEFEISSTRQTKKEAFRYIERTISVYNKLRPHYSCKLMTPNQAHKKGKYKYKKWGKFSITESWN